MKVNIPDPCPKEQQVYCDGTGRQWYVDRLWKKAEKLPVQEMPITGLNIHNLYPKLTSMRQFVGEIQKVLDVDMSHPIIMDEDGYVMDGRHRIAYALLKGLETINFIRFEETPGPDIIQNEEYT